VVQSVVARQNPPSDWAAGSCTTAGAASRRHNSEVDETWASPWGKVNGYAGKEVFPEYRPGTVSTGHGPAPSQAVEQSFAAPKFFKKSFLV
jgi:hypothetical protein